ncbi:MAG: alpha-ketoacid dehydrogenase subunit alpha/beta [Bacteroidota bacterium]
MKRLPNQFNAQWPGVLADYRLACESRAASLLGRKEVFMGKAKFGIFGDGKEVAQLAMAKAFKTGDFRSGYYRDQTFMMAIGALTIQQYFAQLYAHASVDADPASAGRMMNSHFATRFLDHQGQWKPLAQCNNVAADLSSNGSQMPRLVGLAYASKLYRQNPHLAGFQNFSCQGNEIAFGTIGNAATSEGMFFEAINAAGVLQVPMLVSVWDDAYGISVPSEYHTTKEDIAQVLKGFQRTANEPGYEIFSVKGWDYARLCATYQKAAHICRTEHVPVLIHVKEMTQPQGHSTSGSHERYKSKERLAWEAAYDCLKKMRAWMLTCQLASAAQLDTIEQEAHEEAQRQKNAAWKAFQASIQQDHRQVIGLLQEIVTTETTSLPVAKLIEELRTVRQPTRLHAHSAVKRALYMLRDTPYLVKKPLLAWIQRSTQANQARFSTHLYSASKEAALHVSEVKPVIPPDAPLVDGRALLQASFDAMLQRDPRVFAIGEDVGKIGDVNQAFAGLQQKYGPLRVTDTGIRECTILGQGIGAAMRGLRPIVEIQYLDYLPYALQIMMDDLATLRYRTCGGQKAPVIIRTRGHRLEGIWHSGSYLAGIIHNIRGIYVLVPRNMTQAAGFYNTLLQSDDPALLIECLNGYRLKEPMPTNIADFTVPLGKPEIIRHGTDITIVTYGAMCRIVLEAATTLATLNIDCEVIDVQTLLPFDLQHVIVTSLQKTSRIVFADEDVPGGTTAYMMQHVLEVQQGYRYLDASPATITSQEHRPAYADDGNYFSKPNVEAVVDRVYAMMSEASPAQYPPLA